MEAGIGNRRSWAAFGSREVEPSTNNKERFDVMESQHEELTSGKCPTRAGLKTLTEEGKWRHSRSY